jgi:putative tryptophan/tyrosine transport system substrate-binding protein
MLVIPVRCALGAAMTRREFIKLIGGVAAAWPLPAEGQQPLPVVGLLRNTEGAEWIAAFRRGLSDSGYTDGDNVTLDIRVAEGKLDQLSELAVDLVRKRVAVIVANTNATPFAISATKSIPIVFVTGSDPITTGFVQNLNRPSGNVTGVSFFNEPLGSKRLEILHELIPNAETVAVLVDPDFLRGEAELRELDVSGRALGEKVVVFRASNDREIDAAFAAIAQAKVGAMLVGGGAFLTSRRRQIVGLAALHKIPAIYVTRQHTEAGGLMSYGASTTDAYRRAGVYVARILKGEKPGDLPVELPTKFELVINLKTAKALGLDIPFHIQQRADELVD